MSDERPNSKFKMQLLSLAGLRNSFVWHLKETVKKIPLFGSLIGKIYRAFKPVKPFVDSRSYWEDTYRTGGTSGPGSYGKLARYKAQTINDFVSEHDIQTVIDHGCGDGNQLRLAQYKSYVGFDVSSGSIAMCKKMFRDDNSKSFKTNDEYNAEVAELALSLDVIFHLVEVDVYHIYMQRLFNSSDKYVIIYSSNVDKEPRQHERHRKFTSYVEINCTDWKLMQHIPNPYPYTGNVSSGSVSDFYIYQKLPA